MNKLNYLFILLLGLAVACQSDQTSDSKPKEKKKENHSDHDHDTKAEVLRLDDGEKWIVNAETGIGVAKMTERTNAFDINASAEEYTVLFDSLDSDFRYIFKMCTTEGVAHDQLHILLFPLRGMFNRLKSPESEIREAAFDEVKAQLAKYPEYFESRSEE